jgi:hypothetical protein
MDQVVEESRVFAVIFPSLFEHIGSSNVGRDVASAMCRPEDSESVESDGVDIIRIARMESGQRGFILEIALPAALSVDLNRIKIFLPRSVLAFGLLPAAWALVYSGHARPSDLAASRSGGEGHGSPQ